jgi:Chromo (CHRromatin Organisation MOdifier) domain
MSGAIIVSDRGPQFVAEFTQELYRLLGIKLAPTMAYHPQGDGQMERVNQELEQYLQLFVNQRQDDWSDLVPLAEFQYNNHIHSATQHQPFLLKTGRLPQMGFEPDQPPSKLESVNEFTEWMKTTLEEAKAALAKSKDDMARYYNQKRTRALEYNPGDKVYLDASDIQTTRLSKKLSHRHLGPFTMERKVGNGAYWLQLPPSMKRLHPVFNVVKLTPAPPDPIVRQCAPPPLPLEIIDGEEEWVVEEILDSKMMNRKLRYLVKWENFGAEHNSWEPWDNVHTPELVADFHQRHPGAARCIQSVEFNSIKFRPIPPTTVSGCRFSEGGWMLGDTQFHTSNSIPFCHLQLRQHRSMFHLTIADPSLHHLLHHSVPITLHLPRHPYLVQYPLCHFHLSHLPCSLIPS